MLDVVDDCDEALGRAPRGEVHRRMLLHRAAHVLLADGRGRLLLQRRSDAKRVYPGLWTSTASGHVDAGEPPAVAAARELAEEVGLVAGLAHRGTFRFEDASVGEREIGHVFVGLLAGVPRPDAAEVAEVRLFAPDELAGLLRAEPARFAPSFPGALKVAKDHRPSG